MPTPAPHPAVLENADDFDPGIEFDRQVQTLHELGYPALTDQSAAAFTDLLAPLRQVVIDRARTHAMQPPTPDQVPFLVVVGTELAAAHRTMELTALGNRPGLADYDPDDLARFTPIDDLPVPAAPAYVVFDVERGTDTVGATPDEAMVTIAGRGRTPITIAEGIALITLYPATLEKNRCFHTAGSRCGDQRVPALWISKRAPKLGWCWARNRHTWLGVASCGDRVGAS